MVENENTIQCCPDYTECVADIKSLMNDIVEIKKNDEKRDNRLDKLEEIVNTIDKNLGERMMKLETMIEMNSKSTNEKLDRIEKTTNENNDKLDKKMDKIIEGSAKEKDKKEDRNYDWLKSLGLIVAGILIAYVLKKAGIS